MRDGQAGKSGKQSSRRGAARRLLGVLRRGAIGSINAFTMNWASEIGDRSGVAFTYQNIFPSSHFAPNNLTVAVADSRACCRHAACCARSLPARRRHANIIITFTHHQHQPFPAGQHDCIGGGGGGVRATCHATWPRHAGR